MMIQPQINGLAIAGKYQSAIHLLQKGEETYGAQNRLLYYLDYGTVLHYAGRYEESSLMLEKAKKLYDDLYTVSLTGEFVTWFVNDTTAPYRGEDHERVMINLIEALNYLALRDVEEAIVEARDVDGVLKAINRQYPAGKTNVYDDDAWARFLTGILYEAQDTPESRDDAWIAYQRAADVYTERYASNYDVAIPDVLKQNILTLSRERGEGEFQKWRARFPSTPFVRYAQKKNLAEVYLIDSYGLSPVKYQWALAVPLPGEIVGKLAFPRYEDRAYEDTPGVLKAVRTSITVAEKAEAQIVQDIGAIARQNLSDRQLRVVAKAALRSAGKYVLEDMGRQDIEERHGRTAGYVFSYLSTLFNLISEQADLRVWQTLPDKIRMSRLILNPGTYRIFYNDRFLGEETFKAGDKKFYVVRTPAY